MKDVSNIGNICCRVMVMCGSLVVHLQAQFENHHAAEYLPKPRTSRTDPGLHVASAYKSLERTTALEMRKKRQRNGSLLSSPVVVVSIFETAKGTTSRDQKLNTRRIWQLWLYSYTIVVIVVSNFVFCCSVGKYRQAKSTTV